MLQRQKKQEQGKQGTGAADNDEVPAVEQHSQPQRNTAGIGNGDNGDDIQNNGSSSREKAK